MDKPRTWIELVAKWNGSMFSGYDQTDGSHIFDSVGKRTRFVLESDYEALKADRDFQEGSYRAASSNAEGLAARVRELKADRDKLRAELATAKGYERLHDRCSEHREIYSNRCDDLEAKLAAANERERVLRDALERIEKEDGGRKASRLAHQALVSRDTKGE